MVDLQNNLAEFKASNVQPVVLVMGTPEQTTPLVEKFKLTMPVVCDPARKAYRAYQIPKGTLSQYLGWRIWFPGLKGIYRSGGGKPVGDVTQMHGTVLVNTDGQIQNSFTAKHSAHYPTLQELTQS